MIFGFEIFTYGDDWCGFDIPSETIENCLSDIDDKNTYDDIMISIVDTIKEDTFAHRLWPKGHPVEGQPVMLRDYQVEIVNNFLQNTQSIQEIATGAGKTQIAYNVFLKIKPKNILIFSPRIAIKNQNNKLYDGLIIMTDGGAPKPDFSRLRRCWVLCPNTSLYFGDQYRVNNKIQLQGGLRYTYYRFVGAKKSYIYRSGVPRSENSIVDSIQYQAGQTIQTYHGYPTLLFLVLIL